MAKVHGKNSRIYLNTLDVSGVSNNWTVGVSGEAVDVTCFSNDYRSRIPGVNDWAADVAGFMELDTTTLGEELIVNGSMEEDDHWTDAGDPLTNTQDSDESNSGTYSRNTTTDADNDGIVSDAFTTYTGVKYQIEAFVYVGEMETNDITMTMLSGDGANTNTIGAITALSAWTSLSGIVNETVGGSAAVLYIRQNGAGSADFYVDDVTVKPLWQYDSFLENTTGGSVVFGVFPNGTADGAYGHEGVALDTTYAITGPTDGAVATQTSMSGSDLIARSHILSSCASYETEASAAGTVRDFGASRTNAVGFMRLTSASGYGTAASFVIQDSSASDGTFADLISFTAACGAKADMLKASGSVDRWLRAKWDVVEASSVNLDFIVSVQTY